MDIVSISPLKKCKDPENSLLLYPDVSMKDTDPEIAALAYDEEETVSNDVYFFHIIGTLHAYSFYFREQAAGRHESFAGLISARFRGNCSLVRPWTYVHVHKTDLFGL
jgi:hypothetical protein